MAQAPETSSMSSWFIPSDDMSFTSSFHRGSLMVPVSSPSIRLATTPFFPFLSNSLGSYES